MNIKTLELQTYFISKGENMNGKSFKEVAQLIHKLHKEVNNEEKDYIKKLIIGTDYELVLKYKF